MNKTLTEKDTNTWVGKISSIKFGFGGYQDAMFGVSFQFSSQGIGVGTFWGMWPFAPDKGAKWTVEDQQKQFAKVILEEVL